MPPMSAYPSTGATEVARAAADMILLAPDLSVLAAGVREGRRTFANILKYVRMGTSSNFGNMLSMALASIVLPFLPLLPLQILLNNLLYDLSEIGIPFDDVDHEDVERPQAWDMRGILRFTIIMGAVSSLFDATTFLVLLKVLRHRCGTVPDRLVPRIDRDADPGDLPDPFATPSLACEPATPNSCRNVDRRCRCRRCTRPWTLALAVWFQRATDVAAGDDWRDHTGVSLDGRKRQTRGASRRDDGVSQACTLEA